MRLSGKNKQIFERIKALKTYDRQEGLIDFCLFAIGNAPVAQGDHAKV